MDRQGKSRRISTGMEVCKQLLPCFVIVLLTIQIARGDTVIDTLIISVSGDRVCSINIDTLHFPDVPQYTEKDTVHGFLVSDHYIRVLWDIDFPISSNFSTASISEGFWYKSDAWAFPLGIQGITYIAGSSANSHSPGKVYFADSTMRQAVGVLTVNLHLRPTSGSDFFDTIQIQLNRFFTGSFVEQSSGTGCFKGMATIYDDTRYLSGISHDSIFGINLPPLSLGDLSCFDYNEDGLPDILLSGNKSTSGIQGITYFIDGEGKIDSTTFPGLYQSASDFGDIDNDGDLDVVICGEDNANNLVTNVYHNFFGSWVLDSSRITGVSDGDIKFFDFDHDMDLDLVVTGFAGDRGILEIWENTINGFVLKTELPGLIESSIELIDYDNDNDFDFFVSGYSLSDGYVARLYTNDNGAFTHNSSQAFAGVKNGAIAAADYDGNGTTDLIYAGFDGSKNLSILYSNVQGVFTPTYANIDSVRYGRIIPFNLNSDNAPDLWVIGENNASHTINTDYMNTSQPVVERPVPPSSLKATVDTSRGGHILSWARSESESQMSVTYNIYVGTSAKEDDVVAAHSNIANGKLRIMRYGNCGKRNSYYIHGLPQGIYYFGVQTVSDGFVGSTFSTDVAFISNASSGARPHSYQNTEAPAFTIMHGRTTSLQIASGRAGIQGEIRIVNLSGRTIYKRIIKLNLGINIYPIDDEFANSMNVLQALIGGKTSIIKFAIYGH